MAVFRRSVWEYYQRRRILPAAEFVPGTWAEVSKVHPSRNLRLRDGTFRPSALEVYQPRRAFPASQFVPGVLVAISKVHPSRNLRLRDAMFRPSALEVYQPKRVLAPAIFVPGALVAVSRTHPSRNLRLRDRTFRPSALEVYQPARRLWAFTTGAGVEIFHITHEVGDLSEYTSTVTDGGDLSVTGAAALVGDYGLSALIDGTGGIYGEIEYTQIATGVYRWRFYVDPNGLTMAGGDEFYLCRMTKQETSTRADVNLKYSSGYYINARVREDDGTNRVTADYAITDDVHYIECLVEYASGPTGNDGILTLWIDGVQKESITDVDLDSRSQPDEAFLGPHSNIDAGTSGTLYLDDFVLRDDSTEIGAAPAAAAGNPWYAYAQQ